MKSLLIASAGTLSLGLGATLLILGCEAFSLAWALRNG